MVQCLDSVPSTLTIKNKPTYQTKPLKLVLLEVIKIVSVPSVTVRKILKSTEMESCYLKSSASPESLLR